MEKYEERIIRAMYEEGNKITPSEALKDRIDREINNIEWKRMEEKRSMRKFHIKKFVVVAVAACFVNSTAVFAGGTVTGYITGIGGYHEFKSYDEMDQAKEKTGFDFSSVEEFSNGYSFNNMQVGTVDKMDENGNRFGTFNEWTGSYTDESGNEVSLYINETLPQDETDAAEEPHDRRDMNGVTLNYAENSYMFVPADYELTEEDKEFDAQPHCYISYGSDEVEHSIFRHVTWDKDGVHYDLFAKDSPLEMEDLYEMAGEIIGE